MILYDLKCHQDHVFEAWFSDSAGFAAQAAGGEVVCPVCGSKKIGKALMAPNVNKGRSRAAGLPPESREVAVADSQAATQKAAELRRMLRGLRQHVEQNCDYVGPEFAEEARKIHYGEAEVRAIYGETTDEEAEALSEEGVPFSRIPWLPKENA
jgi:hypothetical protein